jgi:hypothetical protein
MPTTPKTAPELLLTLFTGTYAQCDLDHRGWLDIRAKRGDTRPQVSRKLLKYVWGQEDLATIADPIAAAVYLYESEGFSTWKNV